MGLTTGFGPLGERPQGSFDFEHPAQVRYVEPYPRRVRAVKDGVTVADSRRVQLLWETGKQPRYAFAADDVTIPADPAPGLEGHVTLAWDAVDAWFEEEEQVFVHVRDQYHRIDVLETASRVRVSSGGQTLAEGTPRILFETALPPRYYFDRPDVRLDLLTPSESETG